MFRNIRNTVITLLSAATLLLVPMAAAAPAFAASSSADIRSNLCGGSTLTVDDNSTGSCASDTSSGTSTINDLVAKVVNIFSIIVGIVAVIMIIVGGFRYITSGGDSGNISSAKNTIIYAIIGLVIVAMAQFIVKYVLNKVTQTGS